VLSATSIVFSAIYSVWLYNRIAFGTLKTKYIQRFTDLTLDEFSVLFWLLIPMLFLGLNGKIVFVFTDFALRDLLIF
jgi:NADH:ubiquinone oxidoreductase subunit 4 (subunit M)